MCTPVVVEDGMSPHVVWALLCKEGVSLGGVAVQGGSSITCRQGVCKETLYQLLKGALYNVPLCVFSEEGFIMIG